MIAMLGKSSNVDHAFEKKCIQFFSRQNFLMKMLRQWIIPSKKYIKYMILRVQIVRTKKSILTNRQLWQQSKKLIIFWISKRYEIFSNQHGSHLWKKNQKDFSKTSEKRFWKKVCICRIIVRVTQNVAIFVKNWFINNQKKFMFFINIECFWWKNLNFKNKNKKIILIRKMTFWEKLKIILPNYGTLKMSFYVFKKKIYIFWVIAARFFETKLR